MKNGGAECMKGQENVTWPGKPPYFALSSGTTGKSSKRIPVTEDMVEAIQANRDQTGGYPRKF